MGLTTTQSAASGHSLSSKTKCWECNQPSAAFRMDPNTNREICLACAALRGLDMPIEESDEAIGTVEPAPEPE